VNRTGAKMQKGTGRARHHSARAPQFRGGGKAHGPVVRSHEHDLPKKVRALGLKHALSAKAKSSSIIIIDELKLAEAKTKALAANLETLGLTNALMIGGAEVDQGFARPLACTTSTCCRSRASTSTTFCAAAAGPLEGGGRGSRGALQMTDLRHYDVIVAPAITEKSTMASEQNQVVFNVAKKATKPQIKAAVEALFNVKVTGVNTMVRKGKTKRFRGTIGQLSDVKKAVVTLADGHSIDVATGL
jgi:ribosomal protein L23